MATEIPEGWPSWKAHKNWVMARIQPAQDAALVAPAQRNLFVSARDLKIDSGFPGQKSQLISRLKEAGLGTRHVALKQLLTDEHKL
jgi:hypothetical protein